MPESDDNTAVQADLEAETEAVPPSLAVDATDPEPKLAEAAGSNGGPAHRAGQGEAPGAAAAKDAAETKETEAATFDGRAEGAAEAAESLEDLKQRYPALAAALEGNPELAAPIGALIGGRKELTAYREVFATAEEAKQAASSAHFLAGVDRLYYSQDPAAAGEFLQQLYQSQFLRDPDTGEVLRDASGAPVSSGAYGRITGAYRDLLFTSLSQQADAHGDDALAGAVRLIQGRISGEAEAAGKNAEESGSAARLPAHVRQRLERLEALERREKQAGRGQDAAQAGHTPNDLAALAQAVGAAVRSDIEQTIDAAALPPYLKSKVVEDIFSALNQQAAGDPAFQARMDALLRIAAAPGAAETVRARIVAAVRAHAKPRMGRAAQRVLTEAGAGLREQQRAVAAKVTAQRRQAEVKSGGGAPPPARRSTPSQVRQLEQTLGRRLSDREILDL